jgi:hypothetical protein
MKLRVITRNDIFDHNYCKSYDIVSSLICIIIDHMYVQINSCINKLCHRQWRIQGGVLGLQPHRRISQAHILTYAFQG